MDLISILFLFFIVNEDVDSKMEALFGLSPAETEISGLSDLAFESIPGPNVEESSVISQFTFQSDVVREDSTVGGVYQEIVNDADLEMFQDSYCKLQNKYFILILSKSFYTN